MTLSNEDAIRVAQRLAEELGVPCTPTVLADRSNLVLDLAPHALVARVAMATSAARVGMAWLGREIAVSSHLNTKGAWCTRPSAAVAPGPYEQDGFVVTFWEREQLRDDPADAATAGARLAMAHGALRDFPTDQLPPWGAWTETREVMGRNTNATVLTDEERSRLRAAFERTDDFIAGAHKLTASMQPVHGDAHLGNVMNTERGVLWTDWEDVFLGPVEWDLACLASRAVLFGEDQDAIRTATAAYDAPFNADLVRSLGVARNIQVVAWLAVFAERQPELLPRMRARLALL